MRSLFEFKTIADDIPRLDPTDNFEEYEGGFDPDEEAYAYSLAFLAIPGVVLAALSILIPIVFFTVRCLCCSWRKGGGCWPTAKTKKSFMCPLITLFFFTLPIICGSILVYVYGAASTDAVSDFTTILIANTKVLLLDVGRISDALASAGERLGTMDNVKVITDLAADALKISKDVHDFETQLNDAFDIAELAFLIASCVFLFFGLICMLSTACKWRTVVIVLTLIMPLISVIAWVAMAVSFPMTSLFADTCNESLNYLANPTNSTITEYIPCPDKETSKDTLNSAYESLNDFAIEVNQQVQAVNAETATAVAQCNGISNAVCDQVRAQAVTLDEMCVPMVDCTSNPTYAPCLNENRLADYAPSQCPYPGATSKVTLAGFKAYYEPYACASNVKATCRANGTPITKDDFAQMTNYADGADQVFQILPDSEDLLQCVFVTRTLNQLTELACGNCVDNLDTLWIGFALVGIGMFVLWFLLITAQARMVKLDGEPFQIEMTPK